MSARLSYAFASRDLLAKLEDARAREAFVLGWKLNDGAEVLRVDGRCHVVEPDGRYIEVTIEGRPEPVSELVAAARGLR